MIETGNKGRFEVLRLIGRGAMGAVYLARDPVIGRRIALKTVRFDALQDQPDQGARPDVVVEARTAGILSHPNIVSVYDIIEEPGGRALSIAMEYVDGTNLATLLDGGTALPQETALDFAAQVADGLAHAHAQGVIHRDIKPGNLLVTLDARVKIADFGIAHLLDSALTEEMRFLGTPNYMAPERVRGEEIDHRSDLFSLGVVLYEMLTGRMPFPGETVAAVTRKVVGEPYTPLGVYLTDVEPDVAAVVDRALQKGPDDRYGSAEEMARDLRRMLTGRERPASTQPVKPVPAAAPAGLPEAHPAAPPAVAAGPRRLASAPRIAGAALGAIALLAAGAWLWWAGGRRAAPEPGETMPPAAYVAALQAGLAELGAGRAGEAVGLLRTATVLGPESLRARLMTELAERGVAMDRAMAAELAALDALHRATEHLDVGRLREARAALAEARVAVPDHPRAARLGRDLAAREAERVRVVAVEAEPVRPAAPLDLPREEPPPVLSLQTPSAGRLAELIVDFQCERPKGVLTIYSGERQIFREGFHFVEKTRFLLNRGTEGSFSRTLEHPAGSVSLRVYLSSPPVPTQVVRLQGTLRGGSSQMLRIRVDEDGGFTARLQ
jgi:hypothetical protein